MKTLGALAFVSLLGVFACQATTTQPPAPSGAPASSSAARPAPASAARSASSAPAGAPTGLPPPSFYLVNETDQQLSLLRLEETIFAAGGPIFSELDENGIREDERFGKGLNLGFMTSVTGLAGSPARGMFASVIQSNGRTGWGELYRSGKGGGWSRVGGALPATYVHLGIGNWSDGRVLALEGGQIPLGPQPMLRFRLAAGPPAPLPQLTPAGVVSVSEDPTEQCKYWRTAEVPQNLLVLPSGDVFVLGSTCQGSAQAVEHWEPGHTRASLYVFPSSGDWRWIEGFAHTARDVTLLADSGAGPLLARFDGASWTTEPLGLGGHPVLDSDLAADGTLLVVAQLEPHDERGALWWRAPGATTLTKLNLPQRPSPANWSPRMSGVTSAVARSRDDVWAVVGDALFHSQPAKAGSRRIAWSEGQQFPGDLRLPKAASPACSEIYVLLYAITKSTPAGYDFPLTRQALAGHPELAEVRLAETEDNGQRFFGAFAKDYAQGQKLARLVREKVKGSIPAVLCARPKVVRELKMDWKTGKLMEPPSGQ